MNTLRYICLVSAALIGFASIAHSLECYSCSGEIGYSNGVNDCERFWYEDRHKKTECLPGEQVCAKYIVQHGGIRMVHRSCKPFDICAFLQSNYNNPRDQLLECHTCQDRNFCNSSKKVRPDLVYLSLLSFMLVSFTKIC